MKYLEKQKVIELRKLGLTISEIKKFIPVSKSTISLWIDGIVIPKSAQKRIRDKITFGQYRSREVLKQKSLSKKAEIERFSVGVLREIELSKNLAILICSCLYEGEGGKGKGQSFTFTNSDPKMVKTFLSLLRIAFKMDESKFRVCMHLHKYHKEEKQKDFWSKVTGISKDKFIKTFWKNTNSLYKKDNYQGCLSIRYYDISIKNKLMSIFNRLSVNL